MASIEERVAQLNYELAVYKEQIALIKRETERIGLTTVDLTNALTTIENIKEEPKEKSVLVPIGGGAMIKSAISETKILVPIGAQYMAEMDRESAITEIEKRIEATKKAVERLTEEFNKITTKLHTTAVEMRQIQNEAELSERVDSNIREDYI
ncbi:prefoldin subunit alpha [Candidatus Micrarchaeota archaeon]|nr:prefoldin subunit alpha [Candidatus Micrarchaeota archaeon]